MKFKYNQKIFRTTEFNEALALYYYCYFNNLDFINNIKKRNANLLNVFPDFIVDEKYLEVTRAIDIIDGKQENDITDVFGKDNKMSIIEQKNNKLNEYSHKGFSHHIYFEIINGVTCAFTDLRDYKSIIKIVKDSIVNKCKSKSVLNNEHKIDLFVVSSFVLTNDAINNLFNWYKELNTLLFDSIYISFLSDKNDSMNILRMTNENFMIKIIGKKANSIKIINLIFELGWLNKEKYIHKKVSL